MKLTDFLGKRIGAAAAAALLASGAVMAQTVDGRSLRTQLITAEQTLVNKAAQLSPRARAFAEAQLNIAQDQLKRATDANGNERGGLAWLGAQRSAEEASSTARQAGSVRRTIEVHITPAQPGASAPPLEVYALPLGVLLYASALPDQKLRNVLELGRFAQLTSPAADQLETGGDYAVWVAQPHRMDDVLRLIRQQKDALRYRRVPGQITAPVVLSFSEADQARLPNLSESMISASQPARGGQP